MDAVQQAKSGHPGMPMGMADIVEVLWNDHLSHNPKNPQWCNRDRFVVSNGHGSMLLYSVLHLSGYDLPIDQLKAFRQLHSQTPGHPEYGYAAGVETTTGPLGQGIANAVGMAIAERHLAARFNRSGYPVVDHYTYVFTGDGCLMEGISHEACSLAGTLGLGKLILIYDDNGISIDGEVEGWFTDDTPGRFQAYGWQVIADVDGHDPQAIGEAIDTAKSDPARPSLICCKTVIGYGSPNKAGKESSHGAPLGDDEIELTRASLGWAHPPFEAPDDIYAGWRDLKKGAAREAQWQTMFSGYAAEYPDLADEFSRRERNELPADWEAQCETRLSAAQGIGASVATRKASQDALELLGPVLPELIGGSADLTGSNLTRWSGAAPMTAGDCSGSYIYYGVREFAMCAIGNGMALHGGVIPFGGTFLMFSEYARNALRMAALMKIRNIFVFTHDSIGLGEDGPTHQAVEQAATLRLMPNMSVWRPCDAVESLAAWQQAIHRKEGPTSLLFSRQGLPHQERDATQLGNISKGAYVLVEASGAPALTLIATGSEVALAVEAAKALEAKGTPIRVVSMPSADAFDTQDASYRQSVLAEGGKRIAIEAGIADYWYKYVGLDGDIIGMSTFGESAPAADVFGHFGFTVDNVVSRCEQLLARNS